MGQASLGAALLHRLESLPLYGLDLPSLLADNTLPSPEQALVGRVRCGWSQPASQPAGPEPHSLTCCCLPACLSVRVAWLGLALQGGPAQRP